VVDNPIRVLVVDDHFVVRKGVCALLAGAADIAVVEEAEDGRQAVEAAGRCAPQVILMDLNLPELNGVEAIRRILAARPETRIVVLSSMDAEAEVVPALVAGALGYLAKTSPREDFLAAIRQVSDGGAWLPPRLTRNLLARFKPEPPRPQPMASQRLTGREHEVLSLLARGWNNQSIARELAIAEVTVRSHVSRILDKLGVSNRVEAALHALRSGIAPSEPA
jgi:two-component system, NarL family, response regulator LiaR